MKYLINTLFALLLLTSFQFINAQAEVTTNADELNRNEGTLDDQFEYVINKSYTYRGNGRIYKNVQSHWLAELKTSVIDSVKAVHKNLDDTKAILKNQTAEIETLKLNLSNTQNTLSDTKNEKDSMSLFGFQMSKSGYNILLWSIIGGLFALLLVFVLRFKNSNSATKESKQKLEEVEEEFENHRRIALEREQKVRRQLQDEIIKNKS